MVICEHPWCFTYARKEEQMSKRRNAQALAAILRKAGAHKGTQTKDLFDLVSEYGDEELEELARRWRDEDETLVGDSIHDDSGDSTSDDER